MCDAAIVGDEANATLKGKPMTVLPNLQAELELARAENAKLMAMLAEANKPRAMSMKVSEKGALSIYGLGRFPVTLYAQSWERILDNAVTIRAFIKANHSKLSRK